MPATPTSDHPFEERQLLRDSVRAFAAHEVVPHLEEWEREGAIPRSVHEKAGEAGFLGVGYPVAAGGGGGDVFHMLCVLEEMIGSGASSGFCSSLFSHALALPPIIRNGTTEQIDRWVRPTFEGRLIGSLAVTEPDAGSDVLNIRTTAVADGDEFVLNGTKIYITSGTRADFVTTVVRTAERGLGSLSVLVVERGTPGFAVARRLDKMGWACSDTAELVFDDARVPRFNLIGRVGSGFPQLMRHFPLERLLIAVQACATAQRCLDLAVDWANERKTFGSSLIAHQVVRHKLAEMATATEAARALTRNVAWKHQQGDDVGRAAAMAKNMAVKTSQFVAHEAVQIFGGAGYMRGMEVERHYRDVRVLSLVGGTSEIMNELIGSTFVR